MEWKNVPEAMNGGTVFGGVHASSIFTVLRKQPVINSEIHKATSITVSGCSMTLTGTIPGNPLSHEQGNHL